MKNAALLLILALTQLAFAVEFGKGEHISHVLPPPRPVNAPPTPTVAPTWSLDNTWEMTQVIWDVDTTYSTGRDSVNAVPVGLAFTHEGRGLLATLHTIFSTTDAGRTWRNLDPFPPPPSSRESPYRIFRAPKFISGIAARPTFRTGASQDTLLVCAFSSDTTTGFVRLLYYVSGYQLASNVLLNSTWWLTGVASPDSITGVALAGLDGQLYYCDSLQRSAAWRLLNPDKVFVRAGRQDTLRSIDTWVSGVTTVDDWVIAVGSHHWVSRDAGHAWRIRPAADSLFDYAVSFCDTLHGLTGGGTISPQMRGWVHVTTDGGQTWSGRVLNTSLPIRAVAMVTPEVGFAAGGDYTQGVGRIWATTDGGQTWRVDLVIPAEIRSIAGVRSSTAYVDVVAAGVFADFRGGVWRTRLYLPDTSGAVLVADPDTLEFGVHPAGERDTLYVHIRNVGTAPDTVTGITGGTAVFSPIWPAGQSVALSPGDRVELHVAFLSDTDSVNTAHLQILNRASGLVELFCRSGIPLSASPEPSRPLPDLVSLQVWPNPGNAVFAVRYELPRRSRSALRVYDLTGRLAETLFDGIASAGEHTITWDASRHASGIYFVRLDLDNAQAHTQKVLLIK